MNLMRHSRKRPAGQASCTGAAERPASTCRAGLTLVELLVVIMILTTVVAVAIPLMSPSNQTRRLREAARTLQTAVTTAQTRATQRGRPYGLWLERQSAVQIKSELVTNASASVVDLMSKYQANRGAVQEIYFCEEPLPYAGIDIDSTCVVQPTGDPSGTWRAWIGRLRIAPRVPGAPQSIPTQWIPEPLPEGLIRQGDRLVIHGFEFAIVDQTNVDANGFFLTRTNPLFVQPLDTRPWKLGFALPGIPGGENGQSGWSRPAPFQIRRQPQRVDDPIQLPTGIAIDLEGSGDLQGFFHDPKRPSDNVIPNDNDSAVTILFNPEGSLSQIIRNDGTPQQPIVSAYPGMGTIHLLVTERENVGVTGPATQPAGDLTQTSWLDPESLYVSIAPRTGRVATSDLPAVANLPPAIRTGQTPYETLVLERDLSRDFARSLVGRGGQ